MPPITPDPNIESGLVFGGHVTTTTEIPPAWAGNSEDLIPFYLDLYTEF